MRVAINGFGRIGREFLRVAIQNNLNVVAINDPNPLDNAAYLLKYDSVHGILDEKVTKSKNHLVLNGKKILYTNERDPSKLPWKKLDVDIVIGSSGHFTKDKDAEKLLKTGAKKVLMSAPIEHPKSKTICPGVNDYTLKKQDKIISMASCTTNCLAPVLKIINKELGIKHSLVTTVHAYTNDQRIQDSFHKKYRRGRAGAINIIPTTTGASKAVAKVLPELKGKISGLSIRVPVSDVSISDLVIEVKKKANAKKINSILKKASQEEYAGILDYTEEPLVSSDFVGNQHSAVIDGLSTEVNGNLVKILAWYDNEFGYATRLVDLVKIIERL